MNIIIITRIAKVVSMAMAMAMAMMNANKQRFEEYGGDNT
jgi:hypothetical protein